MKDYGWHSFRRPLATLLPVALAQTGKPLTYVGYFLRWSQKSIGYNLFGTPMPGVYGREEILDSDPLFVDREVLKVHPFLHLWADKGQ